MNLVMLKSFMIESYEITIYAVLSRILSSTVALRYRVGRFVLDNVFATSGLSILDLKNKSSMGS